jgi:hypothetical protein
MKIKGRVWADNRKDDFLMSFNLSGGLCVRRKSSSFVYGFPVLWTVFRIRIDVDPYWKGSRWIRICLGNTDPDPGQFRWDPKRKYRSEISHWKENEPCRCRPEGFHSSLYVLNQGLWSRLWLKYCKYVFERKKVLHFVLWKNFDQNPDLYCPKLLDPDPYWDQYGSETLVVDPERFFWEPAMNLLRICGIQFRIREKMLPWTSTVRF